MRHQIQLYFFIPCYWTVMVLKVPFFNHATARRPLIRGIRTPSHFKYKAI